MLQVLSPQWIPGKQFTHKGRLFFWHRQVWFQGRILKHAFITWVIARNRLGTRDRMRSRGLQVPSTCVLCNAADETRHHLFFDCSYSSEVWAFFCSRLNINPPSLFEDGLRWLRNPSLGEFVKLIIKLVYQAGLYSIWKERILEFIIRASVWLRRWSLR